MNNTDKKFYVYFYYRNDTNDVCYIGKGCNGRVRDIKGHNTHVNRIYNKHGITWKIIKDNLTNEEALELEEEYIRHYVFDLGYSIEVDGYRDRQNIHSLCNHDLGGNGKGISHLSKEEREKRSKNWLGDKNIAKREDVRAKLSKHAKENNSFAKQDVKEKIAKKTKERMNRPEIKEKYRKSSTEYWKTHKVPNSIEILCEETDETFWSINKAQKWIDSQGGGSKTLGYALYKKTECEIIINEQTYHFRKLV